MKVVDRDIESIFPYERNPRHNEDAVQAVMESIKTFGFRQPIVVDKDGVIVAGHTRWMAARQLGLSKVPVHVAADLTPGQAAAYRLADNRVGEIATWDDDLLRTELAALAGENFDMKAMGFTAEELGQALEQMKTASARYLEDFDVMPKPKPQWILIAASEDECAEIIAKVNALNLGSVRLEYSAGTAPG